MKLYMKVISFFLSTHSFLHYASEQPHIIQKYIATIPTINDQLIITSSSEKANLITQYLINFVSSKQSLALQGTEKLTNKITKLIEQKKQLSLLLLGFPFKSTNHQKKCLGDEVDLGEYFALITLHTLVKNIKHLYSQTHCTILSDGLAYHIENYDP